MGSRGQPFIIDSNGEVVGAFTKQPCGVTLHGWAFANSATAGTIKLYVPTPVVGQSPALPSASGVLIMTIDIAATPTSTPFSIAGEGWYFKDGLYAITSASTITGCLFTS